MESIWENISTALELAPDTADRWLAKLRAQYAQSHRHYHTESELIRRKVPHLTGASVCIQLAALFQYYHFEADKDCVARNCETVGEFFADAQIENVSPFPKQLLQVDLSNADHLSRKRWKRT